MIGHLASTGISVSDQDKARDFYTSKLGFEVREDSPMGDGLHFLVVAPPGAETGIILQHGYGSYAAERVGAFTGIVFTTDDIRATYATLRDRGVYFGEAPTRQPWGMVQALFEDQDGNGYVLVQPSEAGQGDH